ncbi:pyrroline-5-carboxylate reductase [Pseudomonas guariconensis]|uniref:Pyrroline-5-carboxylate reductase n=1 Tax=Pseudomonas guariconensis TaxID=1288410 RepID=A0AAX0VU64_9PSED|nr:pyrroline-5-carboxylate reductase [Pseudomonas guariconensis]PLV17829.1 pyrroline-5-carboxylate reductase [Pseudomonas guariconensis]PLV22583.1 pyrroline-5-carboxylate reductase [Pseudomonas guariconensis]PLV27606.1 pyrroline-5-carboxylate reductase [Pseudomonas guariconensis]
MKANSPTIAFIGGGNMASAIIAGLIAHGHEPTSIVVCDPDAQKRAELSSKLGIRGAGEPSTAVDQAAVVVLAIKPQVAEGVIRELATLPSVQNKLFISVMAGVRIETIEQGLGGNVAVVRAMPNTPAVVQCGATAICAGQYTSDVQRKIAQDIVESFGICVLVDDEAEIDAVTAVSGSGPAYFFLLMEEMINSGVAMGLHETVARRLTLQTALGAAKMASELDIHPATLRANVTSPNGTTDRAVKSFQEDGLQQIVRKATGLAQQRSRELGA